MKFLEHIRRAFFGSHMPDIPNPPAPPPKVPKVVGVEMIRRRHQLDDIDTTINLTVMEMFRQDSKFGADHRHSIDRWLVILGEEFGEASKEANQIAFDDKTTEDAEIELIQCAAVAIQAATSLRRTRERR